MARGKGATIGFVPTMGALHEGHKSLLDYARKENEVVVCSIFVNPTQFNNADDLKHYPRPQSEDIQLLEESHCDILFEPSVEEMYPGKDYTLLNEDFGMLDKVMEGKSRPGHFAGMITIVSKLFQLVNPDIAYFGRKDFQQLMLIKYFVTEHKLPIIIRDCPTIRDKDGLALSSRNKRLSETERMDALLIPQSLRKVKEMWRKYPVEEIKETVQNLFSDESGLGLDYFEIVYEPTLEPVIDGQTRKLPVVACIAAKAGKVRLIDNLVIQ